MPPRPASDPSHHGASGLRRSTCRQAKVEDWSVPKVEAESRNVLTSEGEA
jgi:hypothetical protein